MRRGARVSAGIAVLLVLAIGPALFLFPRPVAADQDDTVTTVLQPGLNLAGWTEDEASIEAIFDAIPELDLVYAWTPKASGSAGPSVPTPACSGT